MRCFFSNPVRHLGFLSFYLVLGVVLSPSAGAVTFIDIWEYKVEGNSILDTELIQRRLKPYLGPARTLADVEDAAATLQNEYKLAGYPAVFVDIPPQTVINGVFHLQVTETRLRRVRIEGAKYFLPSLIRKTVPSLETGRPLSLPDLQQDMRYANAINSDLRVIPVLKQGPTPDTVDLELSIEDDFPLTGGIELNNYHTETTTDTRLNFDIGYNNLWQRYHSWSLQAQVTPEDTSEVRVLSTNYIMPVGLKGDKAAFYAVSSDSDISTLGDIQVVGEGFILGGRYITPFFQSEKGMHTLILGADYKDFDEVIDSGGQQKTPIDYMSFTAQYSSFRRTSDWSESASIALTFGVREIFNDNDEFHNKRALSEPNFTLLKANYERSIPLEKGWSFTGKFKAQATDVPLVSNEQFSAGGVNSVRGYFESQVSADTGLTGSFELESANYAPASQWFNRFNLVFFIEGAHMRNRDTRSISEEKRIFSLASAGFGFRARLFGDLSMTFDTGIALADEEPIERHDLKSVGSIRWDF